MKDVSVFLLLFPVQGQSYARKISALRAVKNTTKIRRSGGKTSKNSAFPIILLINRVFVCHSLGVSGARSAIFFKYEPPMKKNAVEILHFHAS